MVMLAWTCSHGCADAKASAHRCSVSNPIGGKLNALTRKPIKARLTQIITATNLLRRGTPSDIVIWNPGILSQGYDGCQGSENFKFSIPAGQKLSEAWSTERSGAHLQFLSAMKASPCLRMGPVDARQSYRSSRPFPLYHLKTHLER